ncbi:MAG: peptidoglycan-binding domain-containing protein [Ilumatobacteraceae bacterium]
MDRHDGCCVGQRHSGSRRADFALLDSIDLSANAANADWKATAIQLLDKLQQELVTRGAIKGTLRTLVGKFSSSLVVAVRGAFEGGLAPWFGNAGVVVDFTPPGFDAGSDEVVATPDSSAAAIAECTTVGAMFVGMPGPDPQVALYQQTLKNLGYHPGEVDGYFGASTMSAAMSESDDNAGGVFEYGIDEGTVLDVAFERLGIAC